MQAGPGQGNSILQPHQPPNRFPPFLKCRLHQSIKDNNHFIDYHECRFHPDQQFQPIRMLHFKSCDQIYHLIGAFLLVAHSVIINTWYHYCRSPENRVYEVSLLSTEWFSLFITHARRTNKHKPNKKYQG